MFSNYLDAVKLVVQQFDSLGRHSLGFRLGQGNTSDIPDIEWVLLCGKNKGGHLRARGNLDNVGQIMGKALKTSKHNIVPFSSLEFAAPKLMQRFKKLPIDCVKFLEPAHETTYQRSFRKAFFKQ